MDIDVKELIKAAVEGFDLSNFKGDVVGVKVVENEIGNVEQGGIGIQINNGAKTAPQTQSDKNIKAAVEELLKAKEGNCLVFSNKKQWWAVYKVLKEFCNYPAQMTSFVTKMTELELGSVDDKRRLTYDSLSAASKEVPLIATCSPSVWVTQKDKSDNYRQQYVVAEFLMLKLGIKS